MDIIYIHFISSARSVRGAAAKSKRLVLRNNYLAGNMNARSHKN